VDRAIDWQRMRRKVLEPLLEGREASYRPFNFLAGKGLADTAISLHPSPLVIVDGVYSTRTELADLIDLTVLVEVPDQNRRQRLIQREGPAFMKEWHNRWDSAEDHYFTHLRPKEMFDFVVLNE
jgi:uridine kinase